MEDGRSLSDETISNGPVWIDHCLAYLWDCDRTAALTGCGWWRGAVVSRPCQARSDDGRGHGHVSHGAGRNARDDGDDAADDANHATGSQAEGPDDGTSRRDDAHDGGG